MQTMWVRVQVECLQAELSVAHYSKLEQRLPAKLEALLRGQVFILLVILQQGSNKVSHTDMTQAQLSNLRPRSDCPAMPQAMCFHQGQSCESTPDKHIIMKRAAPALQARSDKL